MRPADFFSGIFRFFFSGKIFRQNFFKNFSAEFFPQNFQRKIFFKNFSPDFFKNFSAEFFSPEFSAEKFFQNFSAEFFSPEFSAEKFFHQIFSAEYFFRITQRNPRIEFIGISFPFNQGFLFLLVAANNFFNSKNILICLLQFCFVK